MLAWVLAWALVLPWVLAWALVLPKCLRRTTAPSKYLSRPHFSWCLRNPC